MKNLGLQMFTCRDFMHTEEDVRDTFQRVAAAGKKFTYHNHNHEFYRW